MGGVGFGAVAIVAGLGGLLFGYDTGVISGALLYLRHSFNLSSGLQGLLVAMTLAGAAVGAGTGGPIADRLGRRIVLLVTALVFVGGALLCALAWSFVVLMLGRTVLGLAIGVASMLTPLYLAEMAPPERRGGIVTLNQLCITLGLFLSYVVDFLVAYAPNGQSNAGGEVWRTMLGAAAVPGAMLFFGMLILPESPRWLLGHGKEKAAETALARLRPGQDASSEFGRLRRDISTDQGDARWTEVFSKRARMPLVVGVALAIFQQVTGINTVIYFAPTVFTNTKIASETGSILVTAGVGMVNFLLTLIAVRLLDKVGRRKLLLVGLVGMFAALIVLGICFSIGTGHGNRVIAWWIILSIAVYVGFFAIGLGPVFWLLIAEIFPLAIRARGMSIATIMNWLFNMLVSLTFLNLIDTIGANGTFFLYAGMTAATVVFTWYFVPETKGRTLEQIEAKLHAH